VRERERANRTREAGHLDEIQGVVANTLKLFRNGAVGFIDWLGYLQSDDGKGAVTGAAVSQLPYCAFHELPGQCPHSRPAVP
jgi:hypothetical protein